MLPNVTPFIAVVCAQDKDVLSSVVLAKKQGIADAILVGEQAKIETLLNELDPFISFEIIDQSDKEQAVKTAITLIHQKKASILMKGFVDTSVLLKQVVQSDTGIKAASLLTHITLIKSEHIDRLLLMSDGAMNIAPTVAQKAEIINHCVVVAKKLGINPVKVGVICAVEKVHPKMVCTLEAQELVNLNKQGMIKDCIVDGPFGLDNAISIEAAKHKGIDKPIAGLVDVLLMPDIEAGNIFYKCVTYFGKADVAGIIVGAQVPIVVTSRADSDQIKLTSIALACVLS